MGRNPRVFVTLDDELDDAVRRIGLATHMSKSGVIASVLGAQREALLQLADALDKARALSGPLSGSLRVSLAMEGAEANQDAHRAMARLDDLNELLDAELERRSQALPAGSPRPSGGGERVGGAKGQTPYINKGSRGSLSD